MKLKPWKLISSKDVSVGKWFPKEKRVYQKNDDVIVDDFTVTTLEDVSLIIPIMTNGKIVMVEQFKPGANQMTFEFPGGRLKPGEDLLIHFFTSQEIDQMILDGQINTAPSITCWYLAKEKYPEYFK